MVRTVITLNHKEKDWLDKMAKRKHVSMAEVIRSAIRLYRQETEKEVTLEQLLMQTSGLWQQDEGLTYQRKIRSEWDK